MNSYSKERFIKYIDNVINTKKISHAYLIELDNYEDDYNYVLSFIKMILCNINYNELSECNNPIIKQIDNNDYPDLYVVSSDTNVINKMLITNLQKEFSNKSLLDNKKIYIIKEAEKLNSSSANTILKFLEEPENDIIAFLLTDNRYHVIDTILSRCQVLSLLDNNIDIDFDDHIIDFLDYIIHPKNYFINYNTFINDIFVDKDKLISDLSCIEQIIISFLDKTNNSEEIDTILSKYDQDYLVNIVSIIENENSKLSFNVNIKLWLDSFFSKLIGG